MRELFTDPRLHKATLVLERTAVGLPVLDLFRKIPARIVPVQLTGSAVKAEPDGRGGWIVPKVELTSLMQVLLAGRRRKTRNRHSSPSPTAWGRRQPCFMPSGNRLLPACS